MCPFADIFYFSVDAKAKVVFNRDMTNANRQSRKETALNGFTTLPAGLLRFAFHYPTGGDLDPRGVRYHSSISNLLLASPAFIFERKPCLNGPRG